MYCAIPESRLVDAVGYHHHPGVVISIEHTFWSDYETYTFTIFTTALWAVVTGQDCTRGFVHGLAIPRPLL